MLIWVKIYSVKRELCISFSVRRRYFNSAERITYNLPVSDKVLKTSNQAQISKCVGIVYYGVIERRVGENAYSV